MNLNDPFSLMIGIGISVLMLTMILGIGSTILEDFEADAVTDGDTNATAIYQDGLDNVQDVNDKTDLVVSAVVGLSILIIVVGVFGQAGRFG